jgi:3-oxoacyl-[acyl-carrier-protein] synthase III
MLGITDIGIYLPDNRISNYDRKELFDISDDFIEHKIGIKEIALKGANEDTSDLCSNAFDKLRTKLHIDKNAIEALVVCTQNPDFNLPHTAAIVHKKLGLPETCAAFDISLGCSGYVYGLDILIGFMERCGLKHGLFFTADPYSKIVDNNDRNTAMLFGDGSSVTYVSDNYIYEIGKSTFGTKGRDYEMLICRDDRLHMNGRGIFNFVVSTIPKDINKALELNNLSADDIDLYLFHQASLYLVKTLINRTKIAPDKAPFLARDYGNTVSSSLPILLESVYQDSSIKRILMSGFGVGLSWATTILTRK